MGQNSYKVDKECGLLAFLFNRLNDHSRTKVKSLLAHRQVKVNGNVSTQFDTPLFPGDMVNILYERQPEKFTHKMLRIIYEDDTIIVVEKKSGLLSIGTDREREKTAYHILSNYVKSQNIHNRIFIVHRLDRDTSGLMVFAKSERIKNRMQSDWDNIVLERKYVAIVEGNMPENKGVISTFLAENKGYKVFVTNSGNGEKAVTYFEVLKRNRGYSLLDVELKTGKKNQIRAHMEYIGYPVAGDKKYGAKTDPVGRLALHAWKLNFLHPETGEKLSFSTPVPAKFSAIFK